MHQQQYPIPQPPIDQDYEISILDILVVLAENLRLIILVPLIVGLIALGVSYLIPPTYQSTSWVTLGEGSVAEMTSQDVMEKVLEKTDWIKASNRESALKKLRSKLRISYNKKDNKLDIFTEAVTPNRARDLNILLINEYRSFSLPKGKILEKIQESIRVLEAEIPELEIATKKIGQNIEKVSPGTEGDNVTRAYVTISGQLAAKKIALYELKQQLTGFGSEVFIQKPTLPEKSIKPKKAQIAIMATLASGFLSILYVMARATYRVFSGDTEVSEKLIRIRRGIGLK